MMQLPKDYTRTDNKVAGIIDKKMRMHLWYLIEDLAALPLFGDDTPINEKRAIIIALQKSLTMRMFVVLHETRFIRSVTSLLQTL